MMKYIPIIKTHTTAFNIVLVFSQLPVRGWSLEPCGRGITALLEAWLQRVEKVNAEQKQCHFVPFSGGARWWMKLSWTKLGSAQPSQTLLSAAKPKQVCALVPEGALWSGVEWLMWTVPKQRGTDNPIWRICLSLIFTVSDSRKGNAGCCGIRHFLLCLRRPYSAGSSSILHFVFVSVARRAVLELWAPFCM